MRENLENFLAAPKNQRTSSAPLVKHCRRLKEGLKIQLESRNSTSFVSGPDIPDITPVVAEPPKTGCAIWRGHCRHLGIEDSTPTACNLYKYI